jgi:hypothetical protein
MPKMITLREGLMMYWCEGDKSVESRTYRVALTSCDPAMLKLFVNWLEEYFGVESSLLKVRLHLWPTADEKLAKEFWAQNLEIPLTNFTKTWTKPRGQGISKNIHVFGVCRVSISSKMLLLKIIESIKKEFL